jgi:hypothetical protein
MVVASTDCSDDCIMPRKLERRCFLFIGCSRYVSNG